MVSLRDGHEGHESLDQLQVDGVLGVRGPPTFFSSPPVHTPCTTNCTDVHHSEVDDVPGFVGDGIDVERQTHK